MSNVPDLLQSLTLSPEEIATRSRLPVNRVRELLAGKPISLAELRALSRGLRIPIRRLALGRSVTERDDELGLLFRTALRDSSDHERTVEDVASFVEAALDMLPPRKAMPEWLNAFRMEEEDYKEAHRLAYLFRSIFVPNNNDEPLIDLAGLLAEKGSCIISQLLFSRYEGASLSAGGYCFIFVSPRFPPRMLFTLAHELGHLVAHRSSEPMAIFERTSQIAHAASSSKRERFVDAFASILLLPDRGIGRGLKKIREMFHISAPEVGDIEILWLSRFFGVSFEVAARRCEDLELLPVGGAAALMSRLRKDFGSPEKRARELGLPPRSEVVIPKISRNLLAHIISGIETGQVSIGWASDRFGLSVDEIYKAHARSARELNS